MRSGPKIRTRPLKNVYKLPDSQLTGNVRAGAGADMWFISPAKHPPEAESVWCGRANAVMLHLIPLGRTRCLRTLLNSATAETQMLDYILTIKHLFRQLSKLGRWVPPANVQEHGLPESAFVELTDVGWQCQVAL